MSLEVVELTARGSGAISVLRVRGGGAAAAVRELCGGAQLDFGTPRRVGLRLGGEEIDEALVCALPGGDLEIHVHGSPTLVQRLRAHLDSAGVPVPVPKSPEERAAEMLPHAACESAARILLDQVEGALRRELRALALESPERRRRAVDTLLSRWNSARRALEPVEIVIGGAVNAGKSTLFNALVGEARAIVAPHPGTTRDRLRARVRLGAWPAWISDTAGERAPGSSAGVDAVEREGQERARRARASAELVLWLVPLDRPLDRMAAPPRELGDRGVLLRTFADQAPAGSTAEAISALRDPAGARECVSALFRSRFSLPEDPWIPGAGVPVASDHARAIAALRELSGKELELALESLLTSRGKS